MSEKLEQKKTWMLYLTNLKQLVDYKLLQINFPSINKSLLIRN